MFSLKYLFLRFKRSAPLAPSYNPMPRVSKGHLFIYFLRRFILQIEKKLIMKNDTFLWIFLLINIFMMCASLPLSYVRSGETGNLVHKVNQISTFETPFGLKLQINPKKLYGRYMLQWNLALRPLQAFVATYRYFCCPTESSVVFFLIRTTLLWNQDHLWSPKRLPSL